MAKNADEIWRDQEVTVETVAEFVDEVGPLLPASSSSVATYWFRGQSNHSWSLRPSFLRFTGDLGLTTEDAIELESAAKQEFSSKAHLYVPGNLLDKVKTSPCWWGVMQHHGAPTRLLDWSASPYVAAYFAAQQDGSASDGAVWCFCSAQLRQTFEKQYGRNLPAFTLSEQDDDDVMKLHERLQDPGAVRVVAPIVFPFFSSERIASQQGAFTMCLLIHQKHDCISEQVGPGYIKRIRIPHGTKPAFLTQLRMMNITASAMFPGIDGLGRSVEELVSLGSEYEKFCTVPPDSTV